MKKSTRLHLLPILILLTIILLIIPGKIKAQENLFNYSINAVSFSVKVNTDLSTQNEVHIDNTNTGLTILSWPIPQDSRNIKIFVDNQEEKYNLVSKSDTQFLIFNAGNDNLITYDYAIGPEQNKNNWELFIPIIREPHIYIPSFKFNLTLPKGATFNQIGDKTKIYLVHNLEPGVISENAQANIYSAELKIEPTTIASFQGETAYQFQISTTNQLINIINHNFLVISLTMALAIILSVVIFLYFYLFSYDPSRKADPPESFLEKGYLYFKKINPETIAATILSWGEKGLITIIEKDDGIFVLGKTESEPKLPAIEKNLWNYIFQKGDLALNLNKIEEHAERTIVFEELIDLEQTAVQKLEQDGYIKNTNKLARMGLSNLLLILSLLIMTASAIASWLTNINWLVLPAIVFNLSIIVLGEQVPVFIIMTGKGRSAISQLKVWEKKLEEQLTKNLTFNTLIHNLPFMVFFSLEEKVAQFSQSLPIGNYQFYVPDNPSQLPADAIKNILNFIFIISRNLNRLKEL